MIQGKFYQDINLESRNEMIHFLNNHPTSKVHTAHPNMWTFANNIGFIYNLPEKWHKDAFEAITDEPKDIIDKMIVRFKHKVNFKYAACRSDYNDNILLLLHRIDRDGMRALKIRSFDWFGYEEFSMPMLIERTIVLQAFDRLCDNIVLEYYQMIHRAKKMSYESL